MEWLPFVQQFIASALGAGFVGSLVALRYGEKIRDAYQRLREADQRQHDFALKSVDYEHQLRFAALERRLDVHQDAYARWWNLKNKMDSPAAHDIAVDCQQWWAEHNLFLTAAARKAFLDAYLAVGFMAQLKGIQTPEAVQDWRAERETVMRAGNVIAEAVALPPLQVKNIEKPPEPDGGAASG